MKKIYIGGIIVALAVIGFLVFKDTNGQLGADPSAGAEIDYASDVVGTRVGTTTAGVYFASRATSTYRIRTGAAEQLNLTMSAIKASTTPGSWVNLSLLGSNDWDCATASTTGGQMNPILTTDINWYDIGHHVAELAGSQTIPTATSTLTWTSGAGQSREITLKDLNYECVAVQISSSSTEVFMQARLK